MDPGNTCSKLIIYKKDDKINGREKMSEITIYTTSTCPKCELLKQALKESGVIFKTTDMSTPEASQN